MFIFGYTFFKFEGDFLVKRWPTRPERCLRIRSGLYLTSFFCCFRFHAIPVRLGWWANRAYVPPPFTSEDGPPLLKPARWTSDIFLWFFNMLPIAAPWERSPGLRLAISWEVLRTKLVLLALLVASRVCGVCIAGVIYLIFPLLSRCLLGLVVSSESRV